MTKEWDTGLVIHKNCPYATSKKLLIALKIYYLCRYLDDYVGSNEFLVYADAYYDSDVVIIDNPEIPKQRVTPGSVTVLEPLNKNVVIHKHPNGLNHFSSIDDTYINANNDVSILYTGGEFKDAVIRVKVPCGIYIETKANILGYIVTSESIRIEKDIAKKIFEEQKTRIEKYEVKYKYYQYHDEDEYLYRYVPGWKWIKDLERRLLK